MAALLRKLPRKTVTPLARHMWGAGAMAGESLAFPLANLSEPSGTTSAATPAQVTTLANGG